LKKNVQYLIDRKRKKAGCHNTIESKFHNAWNVLHNAWNVLHMSILGFNVSRGKYEAQATNRWCRAMKRWTNSYNEHRRTGDAHHCGKRGGHLQDT